MIRGKHLDGAGFLSVGWSRAGAGRSCIRNLSVRRAHRLNAFGVPCGSMKIWFAVNVIGWR